MKVVGYSCRSIIYGAFDGTLRNIRAYVDRRGRETTVSSAYSKLCKFFDGQSLMISIEASMRKVAKTIRV